MPTEKKSNILGSLLECLDLETHKGEKQALPRWLLLQSRDRVTVAHRLYEAWLADNSIITDDARLWEAINPGLPFHDGELRKARSRLAGHLRDFFSYKQWEKEKSGNPTPFLQSLLDRQQFDLFDYHYRREIKQLEKKPIRDMPYFETRFQIQSSLQAYHTCKNSSNQPIELFVDLRRTFELWTANQTLLLWILQYNFLHVRKLPLPEPLPDFFWNRIEQWLQEEDLPVIQLYTHFIWLFSGDPRGDFEHAKDTLKNIFPHLTESEKMNFFFLLYNLTNRSFQKTASLNDAQRILELSKWGFEKELVFTQPGTILTAVYKNLLESCLRVEGAEVALKEWEKHNPYIASNPGAKAAQDLMLAHILVEAGRYEECLDIVKNFSSEVKNDEVRMRLLRLRLDLTLKKEDEEPEDFRHEALSLQRYLYRLETFNEVLRKRYLMQVGWTLHFIEKYYDPEGLKKLEAEIAEDLGHPFSKWLHGMVKGQLKDF